MRDNSEVFVGLDVAKSKNAVAIAEGGRKGELWTSPDLVESRLLLPRCGLEPRLEGSRADVAEAGVSPAGVIEPFDVLANGFGCLPA